MVLLFVAPLSTSRTGASPGGQDSLWSERRPKRGSSALRAREEAAETSASAAAPCKLCGGSGRLQGGLAAVRGFHWWPIKAYRPCPACEAGRLRYRRRGQSLQDFVGNGRGTTETEPPAS